MFQQLYTYINILHVLLHVYYFIYEHSFKQVFIPTVQMIEPKKTHIKCLVCSINAISLNSSTSLPACNHQQPNRFSQIAHVVQRN